MSLIRTAATPSPTGTNDDGTGRTGTRWNETFYGELLDAIDFQCASGTNPTLTPAQIIDEVVAARGSEASLDARIDVEHNEDGTHKLSGTLASLISVAQVMGGLGGVNLLRNDDLLVWPDGDASAPLYWPLTGAGATIARAGTGLGDTNRKVGDFCAKVTRAGTDCYIENALIDAGAYSRADFLNGKYVAFGLWVKCATPNIARVAVYDGIGLTYSSYHTGGGAWEFLPVVRQIDASATQLTVRAYVNTSDGTAYFSGATALLHNGPVGLSLVQYQPSQTTYGSMHFAVSGNLTAVAGQGRVRVKRGGIIKDVQLLVKTPPAAQAVIVDVNTWDSAAYTSMFSTRPEIAAAAYVGGAQPDTTYARRCLRGSFGATRNAGSEITMDIDQVGSGTTGADLVVDIGILQYHTPLERFMAYDD